MTNDARKEPDYKKFAFDIVNSYDIAFINDSFYQFNGSIWNMIWDENEIKTIISNELDIRIADYKVKNSISCSQELRRAIEIMAYNIHGKALRGKIISKENKDLIFFKNGKYDINTKTLTPHTLKDYTINTLKCDYNPPEWDGQGFKDFIMFLFNEKENYLLLQKIIGYLFTNDNSLQLSFMFIGWWGNGKGTLTRLLNKVIGEKNISNFEISQLDKEVNRAQLLWKSLNICTEIDQKSNLSSDIFKKITGWDMIDWRRLYHDPFDFLPYCRMVFSMNEIPYISETNNAVRRRLMILEFTNTFAIDPTFEAKIEVDHFIAWAIEWLHLLREEGMQNTEDSDKSLNEMLNANDTILDFHDNCFVQNFHDKIERKDIYPMYRAYCLESWCNPYKKISFFSKFEKRFEWKSFEKKLISGYPYYKSLWTPESPF